MRGLFLLLLLSNLAFIAWQYSQSEERNGPVDIYRNITVVKEGLALIRELPPEQQPLMREGAGELEQPQERGEDAQPPSVGGELAAATIMAPAKGDVPPAVCLQVAGLDGRQELERILRVLREYGATEIAQVETRTTRTNYRVLLPPYPERAKAAEAVAILDARGIKDYFIVRSGDNENAVSLGVFSNRERAERRSRQIMELKERLRKPKIEPVTLPEIRYTVSYQLAGEGTLQKLRRRLQELKAPPVEEISCK